MSSNFTTPMRIEDVGPSQQMVEENTSSLMYMQSYDNDMKPIVMLFDEDDGNEDIMDMEDNENTENDASLLGGGEHDVPSPIFRELNWDVINSMVDKDLATRTRLWNESNELFKGLRFESKEYKPLLGILVLDGTCLMHTIDIVLGMWLDAKKWTLTHDGGHRFNQASNLLTLGFRLQWALTQPLQDSTLLKALTLRLLQDIITQPSLKMAQIQDKALNASVLLSINEVELSIYRFLSSGVKVSKRLSLLQSDLDWSSIGSRPVRETPRSGREGYWEREKIFDLP
ncbi:hypothetical protein CK203_056694 [Vitis vinifera]|uniref:Uncharacterized protein n=1 Tax=Vitis vinifera TaxID=29760 RepID=A0A438GDW5_VITVI|nr:hypothetical protein CK203_056694 [Vitis vinifera]